MAGLASLFNVPGDQAELNTWSFIHAVHHRDINDRIFDLTGFTVASFELDPIPLDTGIEDWLLRHQLMHQQMDEILGITGYDLYDVDWKDRNQLAGWIFLNANEHVLASDALSLG